MAWHTPATFVTGNPITATVLNNISDDLSYLKAPPTAHFEADESSDYTITSTSFVDVDATAGKFSLTITTAGGDVMVGFHGSVNQAGARVYFDVDVDGARVAGNDGILYLDADGPVSFVRLITGLSAAAHIFKLQWKLSAGSAVMYAGAGTSSYDLHPQFWVREI